MEIIRSVKSLDAAVEAARREGKSIGLVPTMGALHAGHRSLVERARSENDIVITSVFVNPTQFNNPDDLRTYPRTEEADCRMLEGCGVDYAFVPSVDEVYPEPDTRVFDLGPVAEVMEGAMRPGHFNGVAQIVSKLFAMTRPTRAYFGEKDFQQIAVIRKMVELEGFDLEIVPCPIVREADSILPARGFDRAGYQAAVLPDTYEFYWTASPESVLNTLVSHHDKFWNDERRAKAKALGLTPVQVHTIASIVEEETNKRDERPAVARLYINRLHKGMELQSDPTLKYAAGDFSIRRISGAMLKTDSPYNTYRYKGLPPGPIRIVEASTLDAVLDAPEHNYLYMCAKADFSGYHDFAADYARHRINAARYHRALDARGIK